MRVSIDRAFSDLSLDESVTVEHEVTPAIVDAFAGLSGDRSPIHVDEDFARGADFGGRVAHGALLIAWASEIVGMRLPGRRSLLVELKFEFLRPVLVGDVVRFEARVKDLSPAVQHVTLALLATVAGRKVATGKVGVVVQ
jgi:3-hydroxybutyryl-CoA dehydratase